MEWLTLGIFCALLLTCIALDISILNALVCGLVMFFIYGRKKGFSRSALFHMAFEGVKTVRNILITFFLIGILTAFWRAAGTIPVIVSYAAALIRPSVFLLMTFLLNCVVSVLTGTSFGTAATMGVICATMGATMGVDPFWTGGAVLSGAYFGDRCSPVSTSALLVSAVTDTVIYDNIRRMLKTALVPFLLSCAIYGAAGLLNGRAGEIMDLRSIFGRAFHIHWIAVLPAAAILLLAVFRVNVKLSMLISIAIAIPLALVWQGMAPPELLRAALAGYRSADAEIGAMLNGGGIVSMLRVAGIVCLSSSYSGIFQKTGLLDGAKRAVESFAGKTTPFAAMLLTSAISGMIACNQTLTILLTNQLCQDFNKDKERLASDLEDTAVVVAPLIPWSIASGVPLASVGAPAVSILAACYLYILPLWRLWRSFVSRNVVLR